MTNARFLKLLDCKYLPHHVAVLVPCNVREKLGGARQMPAATGHAHAGSSNESDVGRSRGAEWRKCDFSWGVNLCEYAAS